MKAPERGGAAASGGSSYIRLSPRERRDAIVRVLVGILVANLVVAAAKLIYGWHSGAIAMGADGVHSLLDGASNVIGLIGVAVARRPPDANHPYGHRKYETFAALAIAGMMLIGCMEIGTAALHRLQSPYVPEIDALGFGIIGGTLVVNLLVVWFERREARRLQSELLMSDAAHTGSDVLASVLVLASFVLARFGMWWADVGAAVVIVVLILRAGLEILRTTLSTLSDERRLAPELIESEATKEPGVIEAHNVRSRGPDDDIHVDLHVLVDPGITVAEGHEIGHRVEARLRQRWPTVTDVVVHVEPAHESEKGRPGVGGGLEAEG
jgi:cation diffusion facilitator family transporter